MGNSEREKNIQPGFVAQLVRKTMGIATYQETREQLKSLFPNRITAEVFAETSIANTIFNPIAEGLIKERPDMSVIIGLLLDQGITFSAIALALSGHIGEGVALKAVSNIGAALLLGKTPKKTHLTFR